MLRPDVEVIHGGPIADQSVDAVIGCEWLAKLAPAERLTFLGEMLRVLRPGGRMVLFDGTDSLSPEDLLQLLAQAGFDRLLTERIEGGILSRGEKRYTHLSPVERIAQTAARDGDSPEVLTPHEADTLVEAVRGKFVFLLCKSAAAKPPWALQPGERGKRILWQTPLLRDAESPQTLILAFSSLPKAVEFMQAAIKSEWSRSLNGINKIAKFDKAIVASWNLRLLLNGPFAALQSSPRFTPSEATFSIDAAQAITGEE